MLGNAVATTDRAVPDVFTGPGSALPTPFVRDCAKKTEHVHPSILGESLGRARDGFGAPTPRSMPPINPLLVHIGPALGP